MVAESRAEEIDEQIAKPPSPEQLEDYHRQTLASWRAPRPRHRRVPGAPSVWSLSAQLDFVQWPLPELLRCPVAVPHLLSTMQDLSRSQQHGKFYIAATVRSF